MRIDRSGMPFIAGTLVPGVVLVALQQVSWALPLVILSGFFCYFFRDPERHPPDDPSVVVAPADGRIVYVGEAEPAAAPKGEWLQVSIFLSPLDVHVNRTPVAGRITNINFQPGRFLPAYRDEASIENEHCEIWIEHNGEMIVCRQVVGILARRIVCRLTPGMKVVQGQRFGIMKFGSRMDVYIPRSAKICTVSGDIVCGGETILATLVSSGSKY